MWILTPNFFTHWFMVPDSMQAMLKPVKTRINIHETDRQSMCHKMSAFS